MYTTVTIKEVNFTLDENDLQNDVYNRHNLSGIELSTFIKIFRLIGPKITTLTLERCNFSNHQLFKLFFDLMINLKKLVLDHTDASYSKIAKSIFELKITHFSSFPNLKELEMVASSYKYYVLFKAAKLTSLKVKYAFDVETASLLLEDPLKNLLATQKDLKTFALRSFTYKYFNFFEGLIDDKNITFKLTELSIIDIKLNDYYHLSKFIELHRDTIVKLELSSQIFFYEIIFAELKNLKSLRLKANIFPHDTGQDSSYFDRLKVNKSVTSLTLLVDANNSFISQLFKHLPKIEHLEILGDCCSEILKSISEDLKNLKSLKVNCNDGRWFRNLNFPSLKALSIECDIGQNEWDLFTEAAPGITHLLIDDVYIWFDELFIKRFIGTINVMKIMQGLKLESLTINSSFIPDKKLFDSVLSFGSSLKSLNLNYLTMDYMPWIKDVRGLCLRKVPVKDPLTTQGSWPLIKVTHEYLRTAESTQKFKEPIR